MAKGQMHLSPNGPSPCKAEHGECPYENKGHFNTVEEADAAYAKEMGGEIPTPENRQQSTVNTSLKRDNKVKLQLDLGSVEVEAGDLSSAKMRYYFANGLCGDLANAIHTIDPDRKLYFSLDTNSEGRPNSEDLNNMRTVDELSEFVFHAVVESKSQPGKYLDAYGIKSKEEVEGFFGGPMVEVPSRVFRGFDTGADHDLSSFAETVLGFDEDGVSYDYNHFED